jgi:lysophospholipase
MDAAPLLGTASAPIPEGARAVWLQGAGGLRLRAALFPVPGQARGSVVLSPGRAEPIEKYFEVVGDLRARGFTVLAHDWRGQGLSERMLPDRLKGHAAGYADFLADYGLMLDAFAAELPKPWIALGHSMGGGLVLLALTAGEPRMSGCMLTAPMIGLIQVRVLPKAAALVARAAVQVGLGAAYVPGAAYDPFAPAFERTVLTHDRRRFDRFRDQLKACPDLAIGGVTWGWLDYALSARAILTRSASAKAVGLPLTIVGAGDERLVLSADAKRFAEAAPQGRYVEIPGAFHEILMETDDVRAVFWREFDALAERVGTESE